MNTDLNSTQRFSDRVENYIKYRPGYPSELLPLLSQEIDFNSSWVVADVGSGTGIFTELLVKNGNEVYAIEPNGPMREAAETMLAAFPNLHSVDASAEATTLADASIDLITCAQAFHWFDAANCRKEFSRILKPGGWVALIWNDRELDTTPFLRAYENALRTYGTDYLEVSRVGNNIAERIDILFAGKYSKATLANHQDFTLEGLLGRAFSSSYVSLEGDRYKTMKNELTRIFTEHQVNGLVRFDYCTNIYFGKL